jgi:putative transposase
MIDKQHKALSVRRQCTLLSIGRSNIYYQSADTSDDTFLANQIHELWLTMPAYGYRKITAELRKRGYHINHKKVLRIMQETHVKAIYPKPKQIARNLNHKIYPYLLRDLTISKPNQVWATDITYIKMPTGFMYLIAIIDIYSRFIVSWRFSNTLDTQFCEDALKAALEKAKPEILNTDQGCQFTSMIWIGLVESNGIKISMDGKGRWADNVFIERLWRTIKHEHVLIHSFETVAEARMSISSFIDGYNYKRLHQSLDYKTPAEVYFYNKPMPLPPAGGLHPTLDKKEAFFHGAKC